MTKIVASRPKSLRGRGRPRIEGKLREKNGRITRAKNPVQQVALEARARHNGLKAHQAVDPKAENYLGVLSLLGAHDGISAEQYEAAQRFLTIRNEYRKSLLSPGAYYEASDRRFGSDDMEEYSAWAARVRKRYALALRAVQEAQLDNGQENLYAALHYVVMEGRRLPHLLGATRMVLNALYRHFRRLDPPQKLRNAPLAYHISLAQLSENHVSHLSEKNAVGIMNERSCSQP